MKTLWWLVLCLLCAACSALWWQKDRSGNHPVPVVKTLRIHGSNTIGEKLMPALAQAFLYAQGYPIVLTKKASDPTEQTLIGQGSSTQAPLAIEIYAHGSSTAFKDLQTGTTDLGMASRRIKPDELQSLSARYGELTDSRFEHIIALDALTIIVADNNPVTHLSVPQVAAIFSGEINNWNSVGGPDLPIHVMARDERSGTWDTFDHLVLKPNNKTLRSDAKRMESSEALTRLVQQDAAAIGFVAIAYAQHSHTIAVDNGNGVAVQATRHTIGTENYPLSRQLYLYSTTQTRDPIFTAFIHYINSNAGQRAVEQLGMVSYYPTVDKPSLATQAYPRQYKALSVLAERLNVSFDSGENGVVLDGKVKRDLQRLTHFFHDNPGRRLILTELIGTQTKAGQNTAALLQVKNWLATQQINTYDTVSVVSYVEQPGARIEVWVL